MNRLWTVLSGLGFAVAAMMPWVTFALNDGNYPAKSTLQFFDAPFLLTGFRLHLLVIGLLVVLFTFLPLPGRPRILRAAGWAGGLISLVNGAYITFKGGGLGAITAADGKVAFAAFVGVAAGALLIWSGAKAAPGIEFSWPERPSRWLAYLALLVSFAGLLLFVAAILTSGGGITNPYSAGQFMSFLAMAAGLIAALGATGVLRWIGELSEQHRYFSLLVMLGCALGLPFTSAGNEYWMTVAVNIGVYAATAIGLNIVVGLAGLLDLGYVAFMGIGAFVAANLSGAAAAAFDIHLPFIFAAIAAALVAGVFGAIVGSPTLRVRGDYLAIVTMAFGEIFVRSSQNNIGGLTGGSNAIPGIPPLELFGTGFQESISIGGYKLAGGVLYYVLIVLLVALVMGVFANLKDSRIGRAWIAIREDEDAARAMGIQTGRAKILAFLIGATLAGLAGAVFAHKTSSVSYESFRFTESVTLLAAVILGGMGTIPGAVLGASLLFVLPETLREFQDYRLMLFGLALVLIMRFRPQGLVADRHRRAELTTVDDPVEVAAR
ncbi:branched-chain amino acid ABC transporter permease [Pseudonocardiaceae bacterium YIM PH 21723]|nr:branched-chain amino acid ABC transporter permease [Pseudonocardiaceae bacterium YIM PH 21723]